MFGCNHDWKLIDKTVLPSPYEQLIEGGQTLTNLKGGASIFQKAVVLVFKCEKCGETKTENQKLFD